MATFPIILVIALLGSVFFIALGTLIYYLIYRHIINKRIANGNISKKGMMSPFWMPVILLGLQFIFGNPLLAFLMITFLTATGSEEYEVHESMEIHCYTAAEMQEGHQSVFSMEENEGYTKQQAEGNGIRFTCFSAEDLSLSWQPYYLFYTEVLGEYPTDAVYILEGELYENGEAIEGFSWYPEREDMPVCVISAMQDTEMMDCEYELQITCTITDSTETQTLGGFTETFLLCDESEK